MGVQESQEKGQVSGQIAMSKLFVQLILVFLSEREVCGMLGVAVKCIDITQNSDCEGRRPALN